MLPTAQLIDAALELAQHHALLAAALALAALTLLGIAMSLLQRKRCYTYAQPASTLPLLGNTLDVMLHHRARMYDWFTDQCLAWNDRPWRLSIVGSVPIVVISTPALFEDVLKTQFTHFLKGRDEIAYISDLFGAGILATDNDAWRFHRTTASSLFSHKMLRDAVYTAVRVTTCEMIQTLQQYEARNEPVSLKCVLSHFTSDVFGRVGFGVDLECLAHGLADANGNEFIDAFATATRAIYFRFMQPKWLWRLKRWLNVGDEQNLRTSVATIDAFIFRVIDASVARKQAAANRKCALCMELNADAHLAAASEPTDLISLFLATENGSMATDSVQDSSKTGNGSHLPHAPVDARLIRDTVVNFIFAGKDTTSHSLSFFIVMLNRYPRVLTAIRNELRANLPALASSSDDVAVPTIDELSQLVYLEAAIRENLRLNPVVPLGARQASVDTVLSDGTPIAKGTRVSFAIYAAGRKPSIWGDDALEFRPERWLDAATGQLVAVSPYKFSAFFAGPRQCIGLKFALLEMKCALAVLLSRFDITTVDDPWTITYEAALTMAVEGPLMVRVASIETSAT